MTGRAAPVKLHRLKKMRLLLGAILACLAAASAAGSSVAGRYRCWSYNVSGAGKRCTSPPLVLHEDGTYEMSSERGTFQVRGDRLLLSESKIRGAGRLEAGDRIVFEYDYKGWRHTMTYLRQGDAGTARQDKTKRERR